VKESLLGMVNMILPSSSHLNHHKKRESSDHVILAEAFRSLFHSNDPGKQHTSSSSKTSSNHGILLYGPPGMFHVFINVVIIVVCVLLLMLMLMLLLLLLL
jgi:hypothetical protein